MREPDVYISARSEKKNQTIHAFRSPMLFEEGGRHAVIGWETYYAGMA